MLARGSGLEVAHSWLTRKFGRKGEKEKSGGSEVPAVSEPEASAAEQTDVISTQEVSSDTPPQREKREPLTGVVLDQRLLIFYFKKFLNKEVVPVTTDKFIGRSKDTYGPPWLAREIVQNFVDANTGENRGTLNGVAFTQEDLPVSKAMPNGGKRFEIKGNWVFEDPTGITSFHSEKQSAGKSAGGNAIGFKQTVLRFMRDFAVQRFEVQGEGWEVDYFLARADEVNQSLEKGLAAENAAPVGKVRHDWLLADVKDARKKGSNAYIIETDNPEIIAALQEFPNLGVQEGNKFLQDLSYKNKRGALKWMPTRQVRDEQVPEMGRLYINGQVMNYKKKGETTENYWQGPEGVTLVLNDVDYEMSVDRPPLGSQQLDRYLNEFIVEMSTEDIIAQLQASAYLWEGKIDERYGNDRDGGLVVVAKLVEQLRWRSDYKKEDFVKFFNQKKYLALETGFPTSQRDDLKKRGFVLCSPYFESIGMPKMSTELSSVEAASNQIPGMASAEMRKLAEKVGLPVAFEEFVDYGSVENFLVYINERLRTAHTAVEEIAGKPNCFKFVFDVPLPKELLYRQLAKPKKDSAEQSLLYLLRGIIFKGLKERIFARAFSGQGEIITTYAAQYDLAEDDYSLVARNIEMPNKDGVFLEIETDASTAQMIRTVFINKQDGAKSVKAASETPRGKEAAIFDVKQKIDLLVGGNGSSVGKDVSDNKDKKEVIAGVQVRPAGVAILQPGLTEKDMALGIGVINAKPEADVGEATKDVRVVVQETKLSETEEQRLAVIEKSMPEVRAAIEQLKIIMNQAPRAAKDSESAGLAAQYLEWKASGNFYGDLGSSADYLSAKSLIQILEHHNQADIAIAEAQRTVSAAEKELGRLNAELKAIANLIVPQEDKVDYFELVCEPTKNQLAQLGLLRMYVQLVSGITIPNDLFLYRGTGSRGVNLSKRAIGLHEELFAVSFDEAIGTLTHEVAHNVSMDHDPLFMHMMQSLYSDRERKLREVSRKAVAATALAPEETAMLDFEAQWEALKAA